MIIFLEPGTSSLRCGLVTLASRSDDVDDDLIMMIMMIMMMIMMEQV